MTRNSRNLLWGAALAVGLGATLMPGTAHAGDAIGWGDAATAFSDAAVAVGALMVIIGIAVAGFMMSFGITQVMTLVASITLGGALAAHADEVAAAVFGAAGGGGSVYATDFVPAVPAIHDQHRR
jgi:hypothetical protein